jgi:hypothetical protein
LASEANLDRSVVNEEAIQLLESLARAVWLVKGDIGDATADGVGAIDEVDSLDGSNGLDEVFLAGKRVSLPIAESPIVHVLPRVRVRSRPTQMVAKKSRVEI